MNVPAWMIENISCNMVRKLFKLLGQTRVNVPAWMIENRACDMVRELDSNMNFNMLLLYIVGVGSQHGLENCKIFYLEAGRRLNITLQTNQREITMVVAIATYCMVPL